MLREPSLDAMMVGVDKADRWSLIVAVVTFGGLLNNMTRGCDIPLRGL